MLEDLKISTIFREFETNIKLLIMGDRLSGRKFFLGSKKGVEEYLNEVVTE